MCYSYTGTADVEFEWTRNQGPTQTQSTGPETDHTTNTASGLQICFNNLYKTILRDQSLSFIAVWRKKIHNNLFHISYHTS